MNKKILIVLPLCMITFYGTSKLIAQPACEVPSTPMPTCQAGSTITINNEAHTYNPRNLCVTAGDVIRVNVTPSGTATIRGKSGNWPNGTNGSELSFTITAPPVTAETSYDYNVIFADGSCKDPRITVKK